MPTAPSEITQLVEAWTAGDRSALDRLIPLIYDDLRHIARKHLRHERHAETLNTTAVVHELYLSFVDQTRVGWRDRAHFFAVASRAMRNILVDHFRRKKAAKRGGDQVRVPFREDVGTVAANTPDLLALDAALTALGRKSERLVQVVECRFFSGMTAAETAEALGTSLRTVERDWTRARAYLYRALHDGQPDSP